MGRQQAGSDQQDQTAPPGRDVQYGPSILTPPLNIPLSPLPFTTDAIMSSNHKRLAKTEARLHKLTEDQAEVQKGQPDRLKNYAITIRCENELVETRAAVLRRLELKQEEVHRLRPCEAFRCDHCRSMKERRERIQQYGEALLERVKGKFKKERKN